MAKFVGFIAVLALIAISILAMDALNGGQIGAWLNSNTGIPDTSPRFPTR